MPRPPPLVALPVPLKLFGVKGVKGVNGVSEVICEIGVKVFALLDVRVCCVVGVPGVCMLSNVGIRWPPFNSDDKFEVVKGEAIEVVAVDVVLTVVA